MYSQRLSLLYLKVNPFLLSVDMTHQIQQIMTYCKMSFVHFFIGPFLRELENCIGGR
jgi:hypothetical protein